MTKGKRKVRERIIFIFPFVFPFHSGIDIAGYNRFSLMPYIYGTEVKRSGHLSKIPLMAAANSAFASLGISLTG